MDLLGDLSFPPLLGLLTWFFARAGILGRSPYAIDLADNPPHHRFTPDHPDLPFPSEPTISAASPDPTPSASFLTAPSQPPSRAFTRPVNLRRPRALSSSPESTGPSTTATGFPLEDARAREGVPQDIISHLPGRTGGRPPSRKRRRLATMRADVLSTTNGLSQASNGSEPRKASMNGNSSVSANGESNSNGAGKSSTNSTYYGHNREEVTRILIQSLYELGYNGSASALSSESGYQLETSGVATFRSAVLDGRWSEAERILILSFRNGGSTDRKALPEETLVLAEDADKNEMLFYLRQQKFLELLERRDLAAALAVLRQELTPLNFDVDRLHALSR